MFLIVSFLTLTSGSVFALPRHEVCEAMRHGCDQVREAISCCCGDRSESNPSQTPTTIASSGSGLDVAILAGVPAPALAQAPVFVHLNAPLLTRAPDLEILFGDLRI